MLGAAARAPRLGALARHRISTHNQNTHTRTRRKETHRAVLNPLVLDAAREPRARCLARLELGRVRRGAHGGGDDGAEVGERAQLGVVVRPAEEDEGPALVGSLLPGRGPASKRLSEKK